jgi:hypothetical protein
VVVWTISLQTLSAGRYPRHKRPASYYSYNASNANKDPRRMLKAKAPRIYDRRRK